MDEIKPGIYQHFKGKKYRVLGVARHSENPEQELVVYQALYSDEEFGDNALWVRPKQMFVENVAVGILEIPRFKYLEP